MTAATMFMLEALKSCPGDPTAWMVFADSLEEIGMTAEAEVVRLRTLLQDPECADRTVREDRLRHLLYVDKIDPPVVEHTNSIGMRFVLIPPGTFWMGSPEQEEDRHNDEGPRHRVTLTKPFWMGMHQVTRQQWETVMGNDPSGFQNGSKDCPVEQVRWNEAYEFCRKLSELPEERATNSIYRLPTEAEWEYACRGGTTTVFHYGNSISSHMANFDGNYPYGDGEKGPYLRRTTPVGSYLPNSWKLYDMHGNVWEWCADGYDSTWYANSPEFDPVCANPYPNGVPWGNRAKKEEVEAEKPGSFQESPNILAGEGDQERQLDHQQSILPVGVPTRARADAPEQLPGLPNSEGSDLVEESFRLGNPSGVTGGLLVQPQPRLPSGTTQHERDDDRVTLYGLPDSEGGEVLSNNTFQSSDQRRRLEQFQPVFPVSIHIQDQSDVSGLRCGVPNTEGGEVLIDDIFRSVEATNNQGRQLELLSPVLPVGIPLLVRTDRPDTQPGLPDSNGGEVLTDYPFRSVNQGRQLELQRQELSIDGSRQVRAVGLEHHPSASERGNDLVENPFRRNKLPRRVRGSGWHNFGTICRAVHHDWYLPMIRSSDSGFRILKEVSL